MRTGNLKALALAAASAAAIAMPLSGACDETRRVELDLSGVDEIYVLGSTKVEISQGDEGMLKMRGTAAELDREPFFVKGDALVLGKSRSHRGANFGDVRFRIVVPHIQELKVKGSGAAYVKPFELADRGYGGPPTIHVEGSGDIKLYGIKSPAIELRVSGSGDIKAVDVDVSDIEAVIAGSGDIYIQNLQADDGEFVVTGTGDLSVVGKGYVRTLEVSVVGSGDARLADVDSERAEVNIVGSGSADVGAISKQLNASVLGSGDVRYSGDPEVETVELGSGEVRSRD